MRTYRLNIAGYRIRFESTDGPELVPSERFLRNISLENESDVLINVHAGRFNLPRAAKKVFNAPYVEEVDGIIEKKKEKFWSIHRHHSDLYIKTIFPQSKKNKKSVLRFSLTERAWDLWIENAGKKTDPMEYPLDGLILYYLTVINGDILIHASGVNTSGHGYLFSGISGRGKTTMAKLWNSSGARVIHDDRLIIRKTGSRYMMFNTPVYSDDKPRESILEKIFLLEHGKKNEQIAVKGAAAISMIMANCIQHNWDPEIIARLLGAVSIMCGSIPVVRLFFKPDRSIIDEILENE